MMTQTQFLPVNLPVYVQCLRVPAEWRRLERRAPPIIGKDPLMRLMWRAQPPASEQDSDLLEVHQILGKATAYDPWEKRAEFFRLKQGDIEGLLAFLRSVGFFESSTSWPALAKPEFARFTAVSTDDDLAYQVRYQSKVSVSWVWTLRRLLEGSLRKQGKWTGRYDDFQVRIVCTKGQPRVILTTTTFMEALLLTLSVDRVLGAKVRKCARPDCRVLFSNTGGHKRKYCAWYCGHIESVRKQRRNAKRKGGRPKGSGRKSTRG